MRTAPLFVRDRLLRQHAVRVGERRRRGALDAVALQRRRHLAGEDVELVRVGHVGEACRRHAEVLGQHLGRRMHEPVAEEERVVLAEGAVVEDQQELAAVGTEALDRVRQARREIPQVADAEVVHEAAALGIDDGDARVAVEHVGPLGFLVPMHLADGAGVEAHVDAGHVGRHRQLAHGDLARPAAALQTHVRVGEREAQVRQDAGVGLRRNEEVGVLRIDGDIARAGIGAAAARTLRAERRLLQLALGACRRRLAHRLVRALPASWRISGARSSWRCASAAGQWSWARLP